jgi:outer membrane protein assembly factor BamD (BamD/ComL family)
LPASIEAKCSNAQKEYRKLMLIYPDYTDGAIDFARFVLKRYFAKFP